MKLLLVLFGLVAVQASSDKLLITVYYESKCSDSLEFIGNQLLPTVKKLQDYIQLRLVPFGKAKNIDNGDGGFECQHGPSECRGNLVQDCALHYMHGRTEEEAVQYVFCEMQTLAGTLNNYECVEYAGIPLNDVVSCVYSDLGLNLQLNSEFLTNIVNPSFVPTVIFNDEFNPKIQEDALVDLFKTACSFLPEAKACNDDLKTTPLP